MREGRREGRREEGRKGGNERKRRSRVTLSWVSWTKGWVAAAKSRVKGEDESEGGKGKEAGVRVEEKRTGGGGRRRREEG